jgi:hypothetical protein
MVPRRLGIEVVLLDNPFTDILLARLIAKLAGELAGAPPPPAAATVVSRVDGAIGRPAVGCEPMVTLN